MNLPFIAIIFGVIGIAKDDSKVLGIIGLILGIIGIRILILAVMVMGNNFSDYLFRGIGF